MVCSFCRIAADPSSAVVVYEDVDVLAFLDLSPIRTGHTQVIPKAHVESFEQLPEELAIRVLAVGQQLAKRMKRVYDVQRVAFLFTGGDVPHVHAHVVPMHATTDITSERYLVTPTAPVWGSDHLRVGRPELERVKAELGPMPGHGAIRS